MKEVHLVMSGKTAMIPIVLAGQLLAVTSKHALISMSSIRLMIIYTISLKGQTHVSSVFSNDK